MSFDADTLFGKIKKVEKELDILRSQSRTDFSGSGGGSGGGFGVGGSTNVTPSIHASFALNPVIHRLDEAETSPYALTGSITLRGASVIVEEGSNNASTSLEFHTINGTLNNGQILTIKPKEGKTLTLKTGGNIDITSDHAVADTEFVILQFFEDNVLSGSNPATGTYSLLTGSSSTGFANLTLSNLTSPTAVNQSLIPDGDEVEDLGHTSNVWRRLYAKDIYSTGTIRTEALDNELEFYAGGAKSFAVSRSSSAPFTGVAEVWGAGANFKTMSNSGGVANAEIGGLHFDGYDSAVSRETFASLTAVTTTVTDGIEDGILKFKVKRTGTTKEMLEINTIGIRLPTASLSNPSDNGTIFLSGSDVKIRSGGNNVNISNMVDLIPLSNTFTGSINTFSNATGTFQATVPTVNLGTGSGNINILGNSGYSGRLQLNGNSIYWDTGLNCGSSAGGIDFQIPSTAGNGFDFQLGTGVSGNPQMGIANDEVGLNVALDMNLNPIKFQSITGVATPTGLEKRFLFSDSANNDELSVKLPSGSIVSLEGGSMSFIGFQADGNLDMNGNSIYSSSGHLILNDDVDLNTNQLLNVDSVHFHVTSGTNPKIDASSNSTTMAFSVNGREAMKLSEASGDPTLEVIGFPSPEVKLRSTDGTPSDGQIIGGLYFDGYDSSVSGLVTYGSLKFISADVTNGTTDGQFRMTMMKNGSATDVLDFKNTELDPNINDVYALGTSTNRFADMFTKYVTDVEQISFSNTISGQFINSNTGGLEYYVPSGDDHEFWVNGSVRAEIGETAMEVTVPLYMNNLNQIKQVVDPTSAQDVATKAYVDANSGGGVSLTANNNFSGSNTFSGTTTQITGTAFNASVPSVSLGTTGGSISFLVQASCRNLVPSIDDTYDLGASGLQWKDIHIDGTAYLDSIAFGSQSMTLPTSNGTNGQVLTTNGTSSLSWSTPSSSGANDTLSNLSTPTSVNQTLIPDLDNLYSLGTSTTQWRDLHIDGTAYLDAIGFGTDSCTLPTNNGNNGEVLTTNGSGTLTWSTPSSSGANNTLSNLSGGGTSINADMIPDISGSRNLGGSTKYWGSGFISNSLYFGSGTSKKIQSSATNDLTITVPSGGDIEFQEAGTNFFVCDGGGNETIFYRDAYFREDVRLGSTSGDQVLIYADMDWKANVTDGQFYASSTVQGKLAIKVNGTTRYLYYYA